MTSRFLIGCVLWTLFVFPAFLAAEESQEKPLDAETQKLWDAHTVVPKTDDIQELRAFLKYGVDNWTQMNGHIHGEETWNRFRIAKNKATFEAANRIIELAKQEPGEEPSPPKTSDEYYGRNDDDLRYAFGKKIGAFNEARVWNPDWEQDFQDFLEELKKNPANKYIVKQAEAYLIAHKFNAAVFPHGVSGERYPFEESFRRYKENFENLERYCTEKANEPYIKYGIVVWETTHISAAKVLESDNKDIKKGTLVKPAYEFYRSLYQKFPTDNAESWIKYLDRELANYEITTAENPLAVFEAKVEKLKKSLEEKTDEDSLKDVVSYLHATERMKQRIEAQRLLLTTVRPFFAESEDEKLRRFVPGFDVTLQNLTIEGQKFEFEAILMDGKKIDIKDYRGKIVIIDYWSIGCGPCIGEIPALKTFYENHKEKGRVELIGFSVDEDLDDLKAFLEKEKLPWPIASEVLSKEKNLADSRKKYNIDAYPTTILIDPEGTVVKAGNGLYSIMQDFAKLNAKSNAEKK